MLVAFASKSVDIGPVNTGSCENSPPWVLPPTGMGCNGVDGQQQVWKLTSVVVVLLMEGMAVRSPTCSSPGPCTRDDHGAKFCWYSCEWDFRRRRSVV